MKFQKEGGCSNLASFSRCELDEILLTGITEIQTGPIQYCTNDYLNDDTAMGNANELSQNVFNLDSQKTLTLHAEVDMKEMGGPRHLISLVTDAGCIVYARIMILPKTPTNADLNLAVSDMKVLDEMYAPGLSYFQNTGVKLEFLVTFYDNIHCAIDFYEDVGDITNTDYYQLMRFGDITISVDGYPAGSAQQTGIECVSSNCWPVARRDKMSELDNNNGVSWAPGGGCQVKVQFDQFNGELAAIAYQDQDKVTYNLNLNEADSIGYKPCKYSGQTSILNALDAINRVSITGTHQEEFKVQDVDNMPPLFCDGTDAQANCPAESYHRSAYNQY